MKPLYVFKGRRIEPVSSISLLVSFKILRNARTKFVTFDVVDMHYPYNMIFGRGLLNIFKAALYSTYLCLKVPASLEVISVHGRQKDVRNVEQGFVPGHRNVNCLREAKCGDQQDLNTPKAEAFIRGKAAIEPKCETKIVPLDPRVPDKIVIIVQGLT
jgi:hypothetical protein